MIIYEKDLQCLWHDKDDNHMLVPNRMKNVSQFSQVKLGMHLLTNLADAWISWKLNPRENYAMAQCTYIHVACT